MSEDAKTMSAGGAAGGDSAPAAPSERGGRAGPRAQAKAPERIVTLEEHFMATPLVDAIPKLSDITRGWKPGWKGKLGDLGDGRLRDMDENGITVQVISATVPGADLLDGQEGIDFAKGTNDRLAAQVRQHPDRFAGFAHLPMRSPEAAADELERAVTRLGFRGAMINGLTEDRFLDDARFAPVLARAAALDVPIYIHPNVPPKAVFDAYYSGLPLAEEMLLSRPAFGWHAEVAIHVFRLALSNTFDKYPGLKIIVGHMGEMLPFMLDRMDHAATDLAFLDKGISDILLDHVYITTAGVFSTSAFLCALTKFGVDRIMFSIDYPYSGAPLGKSWLDSVPLSPADKLKIMHGNADRLLKLTAG